MNIRTITIDGPEEMVTLTRTGTGAFATIARHTRARGPHQAVIATIDRGAPAEDWHREATKLAYHVYGFARDGRPAATNSMIHELMSLLQQVAGS